MCYFLQLHVTSAALISQHAITCWPPLGSTRTRLASINSHHERKRHQSTQQPRITSRERDCMPLPMLIFATKPVICPRPTSRPLPTWTPLALGKTQALVIIHHLATKRADDHDQALGAAINASTVHRKMYASFDGLARAFSWFTH